MATGNFTNEYCVEDSDQEHATDSEDDITNFVLGTPKQRRHIRRRSLGQPSDSSEDEFEKEMESELKKKMDTEFSFQETAAAQSQSAKAQPSSKRSNPEDQASSSTKTHPSKRRKNSTPVRKSNNISDSSSVQVFSKEQAKVAGAVCNDSSTAEVTQPLESEMGIVLDLAMLNSEMAGEGQVPIFLKRAVLEWWREQGKAAMSMKKNQFECGKVWHDGWLYLQELYPHHDIETWRKDKTKSIFHNLKRKYRQEKFAGSLPGSEGSKWALYDICAETFEGDDELKPIESRPKLKLPSLVNKRQTTSTPIYQPKTYVATSVEPKLEVLDHKDAYSHPKHKYGRPKPACLTPQDAYYRRKLEIMEAKFRLKVKRAEEQRAFHAECLKIMRETAKHLQRPST